MSAPAPTNDPSLVTFTDIFACGSKWNGLPCAIGRKLLNVKSRLRRKPVSRYDGRVPVKLDETYTGLVCAKLTLPKLSKSLIVNLGVRLSGRSS